MSRATLTKLLNAGWLILERGIGVLIAFFVMTVVARHLGPAAFGSYAYLFSVAALMLPIAQFGLENLLMRDVARQAEEPGKTLGSAMAIQLVGGLIAYGLALAILATFGGPGGVTVTLMALAGLQILFVPSSSFTAWFKAQERMGWIVLPRILIALLIAAGAIMLVRAGKSLDAFVALRGVEAILFALAALGAFMFAGRLSGAVRPTRGKVRQLLRDGLPLTLSAIAVILYMRVDQIMLGQLSAPAELGYYSIAVRVSEVGLIVPVALHASLFASVIRAHERAVSAEEHAGLAYDAMVIASLATVALIAVASLLLFRPVFGAAYAPGLPMTLVLLLALPWVALGLARGAQFVARDWLWASPMTTALGAVVNIALNFALIPRFGGMGAAFSTVVSYWLVAHGSCFLFPNLRDTGRTMTRSLNPVAATARLCRYFLRKEAEA